MIDKQKHYVLGFSGGKDSTATWLYLTRELSLPHVTCCFADTGHESRVTYDYIDLLEREYGLPLVRIQPIAADMIGELSAAKICERLGLDASNPGWMLYPIDMEKLAILKRRFPSPTVRFCTQILKLRPQLRWWRQHSDPAVSVRVTGVRAEESRARSGLPEWEQDKLFGGPMWRPLIRWTADEVFALHRKHGVPWNPLYEHGMSRVGCFPCILASKSELMQIGTRYPDAMESLVQMERRVGEAVSEDRVMTFFTNDTVPLRFRSTVDRQSGKRICTADDVRRWATGDLPAEVEANLIGQAMAGDEPEREYPICESMYGLCE